MADLLETETALNEWRAHWPACKGVPETPEATPTDSEHEHRQLRLHFFKVPDQFPFELEESSFFIVKSNVPFIYPGDLIVDVAKKVPSHIQLSFDP